MPALAGECFCWAKAPPPRRASLTQYKGLGGALLDECVVTLYQQGASFTNEDLLEVSLHGNPLIVEKVVEDLCARGCRLAEPGEFTRTAYLNGRLELTEAEAVADLISARTEQALTVARRQLSGSLQRVFSDMASALVSCIASLEAYVDFPEEDLPPEDADGPRKRLRNLRSEIVQIADSQKFKSVLEQGVRVAIVGPPNAGKSSLLNALLHEERAIVSEVAGTTRDFLESETSVGPFRIRLVDTAGLRASPVDAIEEEGMMRALAKAEEADLVLVVVDRSVAIPALPEALEVRLAHGTALLVQNKADLPQSEGADGLSDSLVKCTVSALSGEGLNVLRGTIRERIEALALFPSQEAHVVNARQATVLAKAHAALNRGIEHLSETPETELALVHLREALDALGEVCGRIDNEAVLDELFAHFCIGK